MMANSRRELKSYFLPVYVVWALITPTIIIITNAWLIAGPDQSIFDVIDWGRLPALYALFGLIWPLSIVISPAFLESFQRETGVDFFESFTMLGDPAAQKMLIAGIAFFVAWLGPVIHFIINLNGHKEYIERTTPETETKTKSETEDKGSSSDGQSEEQKDKKPQPGWKRILMEWYDYLIGYI